MAPPAVFALPFFNLYSAVGLFDTPWAIALAHCLFNVPLAVWILEGFMSGVPREIDETAQIDGYSFPRFFLRIANWLHVARGKKAWTLFADAYAVGLLFLAISGMFMLPGKYGMRGRGAVLLREPLHLVDRR